jgi:hypothetical protein
MKPEDQAWASLREHAAAQLRGDFADRVLRAAHGPTPQAWRELQAAAAARLRPGFAERVLRAARAAVEMPSFSSQLALSAATAALCFGAVLFVHNRKQEQADARNLAEWRSIVAIAQEIDSSGP